MTTLDRIPLLGDPGAELVKNGHGYWELWRDGRNVFTFSRVQNLYVDSAIAASEMRGGPVMEVHAPKCPALIGDVCTCERHNQTVDKAWAQFCGAIGDGPTAPYPGMIGAFERYYSQSFSDKEWRSEASVWAAAWKAALAVRAQLPYTADSTTNEGNSK